MGNRIKTGVAYVVKLLPIAVELIEKYRGVDEKKDSPDSVFPVGEYNTMLLSLRIIGKKCDCHTEVTPHIGRHTFAVLALSLIHISEPTRLGMISYAVFCLKKKNLANQDSAFINRHGKNMAECLEF